MEHKVTEATLSAFLMENQIMEYGWGSRDFIPQLTGKPNPENSPQAELWMGAHAKAPSFLIIDDKPVPLNSFIANSPSIALGKKIHSEYGELPFLFKVLSAARPLSIQVHPDRIQAKRGFDIEEERLIPLEAKIRSYKDENHKPEMLIALTHFHALSGIRPFFEIGDIVCYLRLNEKIEEFQSLINDLSEANIRRFMEWILSLRKRQREKVRSLVLRAACLRRGCQHPAALAVEWICRLDYFFSADIGIFAPILLNTIQLQPYEAIYMDAGIMHAYLMGSGLEVMANSDNVLRCALTSKHIDVLELMKIARLSPEEPQYIKPAIIDIENRYITPAREFQVSHFKLKHPVKINISSPEIILAIKGKLKITTSETHHLTIYRGQSAFITPSARSYKIVGDAEFFRVFTPL